MNDRGWVAKAAVAAVFALSVKVQLWFALPAQGPAVHPVNSPAEGEANKVMLVPAGKLAEHVEPQLIPVGVLVTVPLPEPVSDLVTETVKLVPPPPEELKVAVTVVLLVSLIVAVPVPEVPPPLQPANTEPAAGVAVRVTVVPEENDFEQVDPQLMPDGALVTVPEPVPALSTWSVTPPQLLLPGLAASARISDSVGCVGVD